MPRFRDALGWLLPARAKYLPAGETKASLTAKVLAWETLGQPVWSPRDYQTFAHEGFMQNPIVYRSVRMIAEAAATIPLLLYEGTDEIDSHPLLELMARPSLDHTGTDFLESWYGYLLVSGNAYAEAVAVGGALREIHALRPDRMKVIPGADGWPEGYEYTAAGGSVRLTGNAIEGVRQVLHAKLFHPTNDHYGMSPIEAAAVAIDTHNTAAKWNKALLDNAARPSGALVYSSRDGHLTDEQFGRLKAELEAGFQGARNAGRPLLLEGGLDWKPLSLSPKDMDFVEAKNSAAREIALALGVPPMLLGIPGDNTYSNYQEASRSFWRQTVLPLVNRTAKALSGWLGPGYGGGLELRPDLDQIEALASEREALWTRLGKAEFLTDDEKRAAVGYGRKTVTEAPPHRRFPPHPDPLPRGARGKASAKFNPNHDPSNGQFTTADGAGGGADPFADTLLEIVVGQGDGGEGEGEDDADGAGGSGSGGSADELDDLLHLVGGPRTQRISVGGRTYRATEAQATQLSQAVARADNALRRVRERDPEWRAGPSLTDPNSIEGALASSRALAQQAEARLLVLERGGLPLGFQSREDYAAFGRSARTALNEAGFPEAEPYMRGSSVTGFSYRTGDAFDVGRRSDYDVAIVSPRLFEQMRDGGAPVRSRGGRTKQFGWKDAPIRKFAEWLRWLELRYGRETSIMVYRSRRDLELRGPYLPID